MNGKLDRVPNRGTVQGNPLYSLWKLKNIGSFVQLLPRTVGAGERKEGNSLF